MKDDLEVSAKFGSFPHLRWKFPRIDVRWLFREFGEEILVLECEFKEVSEFKVIGKLCTIVLVTIDSQA